MERCRLARDIMVTRLFTVSPQTHVFDGIAYLLRHGVSGAPVVDVQGAYLGVFSEKCCMSVLRHSARLAEETASSRAPAARARDFMATRLLTISPSMDVFEAVDLLLKHQISGMPVLDDEEAFLGVFSERDAMRVVIDAAYDQLPTSNVGSFMNTDPGRIIGENADILEIAQIFLTKHYRRLVVVRDGKVVGQICRRDVLRAEHHLSETLRDRENNLLEQGDQAQFSDFADESLSGPFPSFAVSAFMDRSARTVPEELDLLSIAQIFFQTNYRRLPVVEQGKIRGLISRRDLLDGTLALMNVKNYSRASDLLYLSSLVDRNESPIP
jgi:CBS domain-containing protein